MDELHETAVLPFLSTHWLGHSYYYAPSIGSTNDTLKEMVAAGSPQNPPAGTVLLANYQEQGRGRLNRQWQSPPGAALLLSVLFRPNWPAERSNWFTMMGSLAAAETIEQIAGVPIGIKWPNDLVVQENGRYLKVAGLLLEGNMDENGRLTSVVLGIGINVNTPSEHLPQAVTPPTSLLITTGKPVSRRELLITFLQRLERYYETAEIHHTSPHALWQKRLVTLGQPVEVTNFKEKVTISGIVEGTDAWGHILVRDVNGELHTIAAGDVTLRGNTTNSH